METRRELDVTGLSSAEAARRLREVGPNEIGTAIHLGIAQILAPLFGNPLVLILLAAAAVSASLGDRTNAAIIVVMVALAFGLDFLQSHRSHQAVSRLRASIAPKACVLRDGSWRDVERHEVVPGDDARLTAGDLVPADGRLISEKDLHVNEASLTGESVPAEKEVGTGDEQERVYLGTSVVSGTATMLVEQTGRRTSFGEIASRLREHAPETEFERGLRRFGRLITRVVLILTGVVMAAMLGMHRSPMESFTFAVALAVGLTPEFLPMITTLTLARGAVRMARHRVIVKNLAAIQNFGSMDVLCSDKTGTLTSGQMRLDKSVDVHGDDSVETLRWAALNAAFESGLASSLDAAILSGHPIEPGWSKVDEIPFDFERRRLSVVVEKDGARFLVTKGAPEGILSACTLDEAGTSLATSLAKELGTQGYRVLAVAIKTVPNQATYSPDDEAGLTLIGFLGFIDPALPDALQMVHRLHSAGVRLKVITGDSPEVAEHVCREIGLDVGRIVLGSEIERMTDDALGAIAEKTLVFARVSPGQKNRIILALKVRGHVVGYMGDGINDAPSLHAADVGISFAEAADVAKDAAQIILVERDLGLLLKGIFEGRMAFGNVMKYLLMGTSSSFGNMLSMAGASMVLPFLPMLPTQILLNNFLYDLAQVPIPTDRVDESYIRKPKRWDMKQLRNFMLFAGPISSLYDALTFGMLLWVFHADAAHFQTGWFIESLATQTLVIFVIRTRYRPWRSRPSAALVWTTLAILLVAAWLPFSPLAGLLGFVPMPWTFFAFVVVASATYLALVEAAKSWLMGVPRPVNP